MKTPITILITICLILALWAVVETVEARELRQTLANTAGLLSKQTAQTVELKAKNQRLIAELRVANDRILGKEIAAQDAVYLRNEAQIIDARLAKEQADASIAAIASRWTFQDDVKYRAVETGQLKAHQLLIEQSAVAR